MPEDTQDDVQEDNDEGSEPTKPEVDWKAKAREWERRAKANSAAQGELDRIRESQKTAEQKLTERAETAEGRIPQLESSLSRLEVALAKGLTLKQANRLVGSTREELEADADDLLADLAPSGKPQGDVGQGHRPEAKSNDMNQVIRDLVSRR